MSDVPMSFPSRPGRTLKEPSIVGRWPIDVMHVFVRNDVTVQMAIMNSVGRRQKLFIIAFIQDQIQM